MSLPQLKLMEKMAQSFQSFALTLAITAPPTLALFAHVSPSDLADAIIAASPSAPALLAGLEFLRCAQRLMILSLPQGFWGHAFLLAAWIIFFFVMGQLSASWEQQLPKVVVPSMGLTLLVRRFTIACERCTSTHSRTVQCLCTICLLT